MEPKIERRCFAVQELRAESEGEKRVIRGHAAVFNSWSEDLGGFRERILPGAFADSIARRDDVLATFNHKRDVVLGRTRNGTLTLTEDDKGLAVRMVPPDTQHGRDMLRLVEDGYVRDWSFAFDFPGPADQEWTRGKGGDLDERTLKRLTLRDVSIVTDPAYSAANDATVAKRFHETHCMDCGGALWTNQIGEPVPFCPPCRHKEASGPSGYPLSLARARLALA